MGYCHGSVSLKTGQIIGLARETLVEEGECHADQEHINGNGGPVSQLETDEAETNHVRGERLARIDGPTFAHDPDQNELLDGTEDGQVYRCANGASQQRQSDVKEVLERAGSINAPRFFDLMWDILQPCIYNNM